MTIRCVLLLIIFSICYPVCFARTDSDNRNLNIAYKYLKKYGKNRNRMDLYEAVKYLKEAAEENDGEACFTLSEIYDLKDLEDVRIDSRDVAWIENGNWNNITYSEWPTHNIAFEYLNKACKLDHQKAMFKLACEYTEWHSSYPIDYDLDKALDIFLKLDSRDSFVEYKIARIYWLKNQDEEAIKWMKQASESDSYNVLPELGWLYTYYGEYLKAIEAYEKWIKIDKYKSLKPKSVKIGHQKFNKTSNYIKNYPVLLYLYVNQDNWASAIELSKHMTTEIKTLTPKDITEYNKSKKDEIEVFWNLLDVYTHSIDGYIYNDSRLKLDSIAIANDDFHHINLVRKYLFTKEKYDKAYQYLTSYPVETDHHLLGRCYYYGQGTDVNYEEALKNFLLCNDADSLYHIGLCNYNGQGIVNPSYETAFEYFYKASNATYHPSIGAMEMLSRCYRFGRGCESDEEKADYWLKEAAIASEKAQEAQNVLFH